MWGNHMRNCVLALVFSGAVVSAGYVLAQESGTITPNGLGGYNTWSSDGRSGTITPNGLGGYNTWSSGGRSGSITPNGLGGYNTWRD